MLILYWGGRAGACFILQTENHMKAMGHVFFFTMKSEAENIFLTLGCHVDCACLTEY